MDKSINKSLYYSSILSQSPSLRENTSRHVNKFQKSSTSFMDQSSMQLLSSNIMNSSIFLTPNVEESRHETTFFEALDADEDINEMIASEPGISLYQEFVECNQKYSSGDPFELISEYEGLCCDHLSVTSNLIKSKVRQLAESVNMNKLESILRSERNSWRLTRILYEDRVKNNECLDDDDMNVDEAITRMSDKQFVERLFEKNCSLREMQLVIDWLEHNETDDYNDNDGINNDKVEFYSEGPYAWENTLHQLKNKKKSGINYGKVRDLCPSMDPDASIRTKKPLADEDKEDENRLFRHIFNLLRAGQLDRGKEAAQKLGFYWLAASLDGWLLHHDPNYLNDQSNNRQIKPIEGNANRDLWKSVCWKSSKMEGVSIYERALFAALSGNIGSVLPLCTRWSDKLWAYFRCSLDVHIEYELRETICVKPEAKPRYVTELPDSYWDGKLSADQIFREIEAKGSDSGLIEEIYHQTIQKYVILNEVGLLIDQMYEWSKLIVDLRQQKKEERQTQSGPLNVYPDTQTQTVGPQMLRFFAHMVLFLRQLSLESNRSELCVAILESYIHYLIERKQLELVAYYTGQLPVRNQIITYAKLLETIEDPNERKICIILAQSANLDITSITSTVVEKVRSNPYVDLSSTELANYTNVEDKKKINSLDWLLFSEVHHFSEALKQSNSLMRSFILMGKYDAAKETFLKLPHDIIDSVFMQWKRKTGQTQLNAEDENAVREHLCLKAYFQAIDAFTDWHFCYTHSKPEEPSKPSSTRFTDKVAYEHLIKQYDVDLQQWKIMLKQQGKLASDKVINVLLFPDGGWMADQRSDAPANESRTQQMDHLRRKVLPHLVFILHTIHHSSNNLIECLKIADIVADENKAIYKSFTTDQIQDLLKKLRETSIVILNESPDPLGYHTVV